MAFERVTSMRASEYTPAEEGEEETKGEEGRESDTPDNKPQEVRDLGERQPEDGPAAGSARTEAEVNTEALRQVFLTPAADLNAPKLPASSVDGSQQTGPSSKAWLSGIPLQTGAADDRKDAEREHTGSTDAQRIQNADQRRETDKPGSRKDEQESLIAKEERQGIGIEEEEQRNKHDRNAGDDFGMEM